MIYNWQLILIVISHFSAFIKSTTTIKPSKQTIRAKCWNNIMNFRIFEYKGTIKSSKILPIDYSIKEAVSEFPENNRSYGFQDFLSLNPFDEESIEKLKEKFIQIGRLSNIPFKALERITEFLDCRSVLNLRQACRNILIAHIEASRFKFYTSLGPRINNNLSCLFRTTNSAYYLNLFYRPL